MRGSPAGGSVQMPDGRSAARAYVEVLPPSETPAPTSHGGLTMHRPNLAARAAAWSTAHRRLAILGWLALALSAFLLAGAVGQNTLAPSQAGNGDSHLADRAIDRAGFPERVDEQVLVQSRGRAWATDAPVVAGVRDVVGRLQRAPYVEDVRSPLG